MSRKRKRASSEEESEAEGEELPPAKRADIVLGTEEEHAYNPSRQVKIISWNVNGLRAFARKDEQIRKDLIEKEQPGLILIQEIKLSSEEQEESFVDLFPGYSAYFHRCTVVRGRHGVATFVRNKNGPNVVSVTNGMGIEDHDEEGRLQLIELEEFYVLNTYVPNSGVKLDRLDYRVDGWDVDMHEFILELQETKPVIWAGDLNCAVLDIDVHNPTTQKGPGFTPRERESFSTFLEEHSFIDSFRMFHPDEENQYSFWGLRWGHRAKGKGWRLDYFVISESLREKCVDSYILGSYMGSDHCPIGCIMNK